MADSRILPGARVAILAPGGLCSAEWYRYFQRLAPQDAVDNLKDEVNNLPDTSDFLSSDTVLVGIEGIAVNGVLSSGYVQLSLEDITQVAGGTVKRITIDGKGRVVESADATTDDLPEGATNLYFTQQRAQDAVGNILIDTATIDFTYDSSAHTIKADLKSLTNSGAGSLKAATFDSTGRASGWVNRTITAGSTYVTVSNGDASSGNPTVDLSAATKTSLGKADTSVQSIVAGTNITVDNTDPRNPKVSATGAAGAFDPTNVWAYQ